MKIYADQAERGNAVMKSTGIVRKIDELGRVVIPKELRRSFDIKDNADALEIFVDGNTTVLKKYEPECVFCSNVKDVFTFKGRNVCPDCVSELTER